MLFQPPLWPIVGIASSRCPPWSDVKYIRVLLARPRESTVSVTLPRKQSIALETVGEVIHHVRELRLYKQRNLDLILESWLSWWFKCNSALLQLVTIFPGVTTQLVRGRHNQTGCKQQSNNFGRLSKSLYVEGCVHQKQKHRGHSDAAVLCWWLTAAQTTITGYTV